MLAVRAPEVDRSASVLRLGATVSVVQSALFPVIGAAALVLGPGQLVDNGFGSLPATSPTAFRVLCGAFILIAVLGLAITPAERVLVERAGAGLAGFGSVLAYIGHAATIGFFSWWLFTSLDRAGDGAAWDVIAPLGWGIGFELVLVGAWVWIIAWAARGDPSWPSGFVALSVAKATSFWFAFLALLMNEMSMVLLGVGAVTFVTGPAWHLWIARIMRRPTGTPHPSGMP